MNDIPNGKCIASLLESSYNYYIHQEQPSFLAPVHYDGLNGQRIPKVLIVSFIVALVSVSVSVYYWVPDTAMKPVGSTHQSQTPQFPTQTQNGDNIRQHPRAVECAINEIFDDLLKHTSLQASMCGANKIISAYDCNRLMGKVTTSNLFVFKY